MVEPGPVKQRSIDGHLKALQVRVDGGADIESRDSNRRAALHHAAAGHHWRTVKLLLWCDARTDVKDCSGKTAVDLTWDIDITEALRAA